MDKEVQSIDKGNDQIPAKRSRWEEDDDVNERERIIEERAKVAAKAARKRKKENQSKLESLKASTPSSSGKQVSNVPRSPYLPLRTEYPILQGCRSVNCYERLNQIEEGTYGVVFRARDRSTGEIVALKKVKLDQEKNGFPITSLREIRTLMESKHENVVRVREIVVGETITQIFIVMDFIEHDLKTLLQIQKKPFLASEIKTLLFQILSATASLHKNWIIHRDLKTSNLLMNNRGQIKLADFGLARMYGDPPGDEEDMTSLVVTLWYRAPELLLGAERYDTAIDIWSVGCIFAELINIEPLFCGKNETDQVMKIFRLLGQPNEDVWPGYSKLPNAKSILKNSHFIAQPFSKLRQKFKFSTDNCIDLMQKLLTYDPKKRISAEQALQHPYFFDPPAQAHPDTFGSFPSVAAGERQRFLSPDAPHQRLAEYIDTDK
ncbi:hypothetical protein IEQ34_026215 [Dendrobium chrysotoxum]|uniref:Protein kinase domain-containing protein n=1 Tax=Dendrobium chrysotoxum TaxID=161865 RepID=A0AAV7FMP7_DENCH|nr:hypothetical protein IEQ34_026215 [Dendrobium chrysotoxum]